MNRPRKSRNKLPAKSLAVLAMLQNGYDMKLIARSIGIPIDEVEEIDRAEDERIRRVISEGLPQGFLYRIRRAVKCGLCGSKINLVPCVLCHPT